jgi:Mg2+ and Co2+ transporter CorA
MITLTAEEIALIEKFLNREIDNPVGEDAEMLRKISDDAITLMKERNAVEELDGNLIQWYYDQYKAQDSTTRP